MFYHQSIAEFESYLFKTHTLGEGENRKALPETGKELNPIIYLTEHQRQRHNRVRVVRAVDSILVFQNLHLLWLVQLDQSKTFQRI